ncbi:MAG: hypothetical protein ACRDT6_19800 [Micromonosporaceae bacterium]
MSEYERLWFPVAELLSLLTCPSTVDRPHRPQRLLVIAHGHARYLVTDADLPAPVDPPKTAGVPRLHSVPNPSPGPAGDAAVHAAVHGEPRLLAALPLHETEPGYPDLDAELRDARHIGQAWLNITVDPTGQAQWEILVHPPPVPGRWRDTRLAARGLPGVYPGQYLDDHTCDGWVLPRFTQPVAERVAAALAALPAPPPAARTRVRVVDDPDQRWHVMGPRLRWVALSDTPDGRLEPFAGPAPRGIDSSRLPTFGQDVCWAAGYLWWLDDGEVVFHPVDERTGQPDTHVLDGLSYAEYDMIDPDAARQCRAVEHLLLTTADNRAKTHPAETGRAETSPTGAGRADPFRWARVDTEPRPSSEDVGQVGGDRHVGQAWSLRWGHPDLPDASITEHWYAEEDDAGHSYTVTRRTDYHLRSGPAGGGWSQATYETVSGPHKREYLAISNARALALIAANSPPEHTWDGEPFHEDHTAALLARPRRPAVNFTEVNNAATFDPGGPESGYPSLEVAGVRVFLYLHPADGFVQVSVDLDATADWLIRDDGALPLRVSVNGADVFTDTRLEPRAERAVTFDPVVAERWLRSPSAGSLGVSNAENLGVEPDYFGPDHEFLRGVEDLLAGWPPGFRVRGDVRAVLLWLIPDGDALGQGALITVDLADGTRLASTHQDIKDFADREACGVPAALSALAHIAEQASRLVEGYQRVNPTYGQ